MKRIRKDDNASVMTILIVILLVAVIVVGGIVGYGYATRSDDYANSPDDPPEDAYVDTDGDGEISDEEKKAQDPSPDWQCRFNIKVKCTVPYVGFTDIQIKDMSTNLEKYDGDPFDISWWPGPGLFTKPESVTVKYELSITKGRVTFPPDGPDKGSFEVFKDDDYKGTGKSNWFFWWDELEGNWEYTLTVKYGDQVDRTTGCFGYSADGWSTVN